MNQMKVYVYQLSILWLGGNAVILANSDEEAFELLKKYDDRITKDKISSCSILDSNTGVKFFWDGDY